MTAPEDFTFAEAERLLGPAAMERARQIVAAAPPLRPEQREQLRALFASARTARPAPRAADAA